ncbi:MAG TPA: SDR family oxidoreductase [Gemmatimonadales bacterium]|nr:SDR family oxidoreductase [Gemmatimonadales bacterium]
MQVQLRPISDQVVVILGAASGIGRETALRFAREGARVVAAARDQVALGSLVDEIQQRGGQAIYALCDVAHADNVEGVALAAVDAFGRIDTWVNAAAVSVYGRFETISEDEFRRVIDVNFMGQVHGARAALPRLRAEGGALISISSVEGRVGLPLTTAYAASKFAIEGFLDALRRELLAEGAPISITSIKPATINTPLFDNARTKLGVKPKGPPPFYQPDVVADCVLYAAQHPVRDLYAGGAGRIMALGEALAPRLMDALLSRPMIKAQRTSEPKLPEGPDNLYQPREGESRVEGDFSARARRFSVYTWLETHPRAALAAGTVAAGTVALLARGRGSSDGETRRWRR